MLDLCRRLGWLDGQQLARSRPASRAELAVFHDPDYVAALERAVESGMVEPEARQRYGFGTLENPIFADLFDRAATQVGGRKEEEKRERQRGEGGGRREGEA